MKKRIFSLICALALLVSCLGVCASADTTRTAYCEACKEIVTWEPMVYGKYTQTENGPSNLHYYLTASKKSTSATEQVTMSGAVTLCLDLNGKSWESYGRALILGNGSTVNLMDTVGGGQILGFSKKTSSSGGTNNTGGGSIWVNTGCTLNIYSGTYIFEGRQSDYGLRTDNGGAVYVTGAVMNMYGGTIQGGNINKCGGAVYLHSASKLNAYGGKILSGNSGNGTGDCVGLGATTCTVTLGGNAQIDDVYIPSVTASTLVVDGEFSGTANLTYKAGASLAVGTTVGSAKNSATVSGIISCGDYIVEASGNSLKLAEAPVDDRVECLHCNQKVEWQVFTTTAPTESGHYYLDKDYSASKAKQWGVKNGLKVCLDLRGHSYTTKGRTLNVSGTGSVLSVMDTVGGGSLNGTASGNNPGGGTVTVSSPTTFNLYSGTMTFTHDPDSDWGGTARGGVIQSGGTVNIYGGKIVGGEVVDSTYEFTGVEGVGGAIYNNGTLNIQGGEITMGVVPESGAGPCVYNLSDATITLGGDAKVADIFFEENSPKKFQVDANFNGTAQLSYPATVALHQGLVVGVCAAADLKGTIACNSESFPTAMPLDGNLVLSAYPIGAVAATGNKGYTSLQEAIDAAEEGAVVELMNHITDRITISKDIVLELNGYDVKGTVTVAAGKTLYGMDSVTADYTVSDGKYGKLAAVEGNVAGAVVGSDSYLVVTEADGVSFHCVTLQVYAMTLRADSEGQPGLFYKSHFKADEKAAPLIDTYGVALSVLGQPNAENMESHGSYTIFENFESGPLGNLGNASSTLLTGILKTDNS